MKKLLAVLCLVPSLAFAERWLEAPNNAGGRIVLLQTNCDGKDGGTSGKLLISYMSNGQSLTGCWWYFAGMVQVVYGDGSTYAYKPEIFSIREDK